MFIDGISRRINEFTGDNSFAEFLATLVDEYISFNYHGQDMLITFSDEEQKLICDLARPLLKNRCVSPNDEDENHEMSLFYKALEVAISAQFLSSSQTMIPFFYTKVSERQTEGRKLGILYHNFSSHFHVLEMGLNISMYDPTLTMRVR